MRALSLIVEYEEGTVDTDIVILIKDKAMGFLLLGENQTSVNAS